VTPLERAVIEAARAYVSSDPYNLIGSESDPAPVALARAVKSLDRATDPEIREVSWHLVAEGDQVRSAKNGKFYPVLSVLKVRGGTRVVIQAGTTQVPIQRPTPQEPMAFVKRGAAGAAVDVFVNVFSSGETR
jgi:hypothetical protein